MRLTEKEIKYIKKLKKNGMDISDISRKTGFFYSTISYHTNNKYKLKSQEIALQRIHNLGKKRIRKINKENYSTEYFTNRYRTNPEHKQSVLYNMFMMRERRKKKGLCSSCGGERKNKRWILCEKCREKKRVEYHK